MIVTIKYFGMIAEKMQKDTEKIEFEKATNLRVFFNQRNPFLNNINYKIAINQQITDNLTVEDNLAEIALLPPFAGG